MSLQQPNVKIRTDRKYPLKIIYRKKWMFSCENLKFFETVFLMHWT